MDRGRIISTGQPPGQVVFGHPRSDAGLLDGMLLQVQSKRVPQRR
jgi:hypothetical protein